MNIIQDIETILQKTMEQIAKAASEKNLDSLDALTKRAKELQGLKDQVIAVQNRLLVIQKSENTLPPLSRHEGGLRKLIIEVTGGMMRQNLLTLNDYIKRGVIRTREQMTIESLPSQKKFKTELLENGRLQERGLIRQFYHDAGVEEGDSVALTEITYGQWQLEKVQS